MYTGVCENDTDVWRSETATAIMFAFDVHDWRAVEMHLCSGEKHV